VTAAFTISQVSVTVASSPAGLSMTVDGAGCTSPCTLQWTPGSTHTIAAATQAGTTGTQYVFTSWSDSGAASHTVTGPASATTYTAAFTTQYFLTTAASPTAGGPINPASGWYNAGVVVAVSATANSGYQFGGFSGALTGTTTPQNVTMSGPLSVTANFAVVSSGTWYGVWANRKAITIDHTKVSGASALAQFPMLVSITDANLQTAAKADGSDIVFTAGDGVTKVSHEIESYNGATGQLTAWVNVPSVSPSADTVIYLYYGNPSAANQQNAAGVWDANYKGVWHLGNGTTVTAADSTVNAANGTINGSIPAAAGAIGGGASFSGVAANYISIPNAPVAALGNSFTMEAWVSSTSAGRATLFSFGDQLTTPEVEFNSAATGQWGAIITGTYETLTSAHVMQSDGTLHHIVYTKNGAGATHALYLDGVAQSLSTNNPVTYVNATNPLWIGKRGAATQPWAGVVDELRISTTVRTAAWIATEYTNQKTPASFLFVGPQQVHP
jgi:hypothetical protein